MNHIIVKPILHIEADDLDLIMVEDILGEVDDHQEIYEGKTNQLNDPIKIDNLLVHLNNLKGKGANYVSILYHSDHRGYEFDGQHIAIASQEEIDLWEQKNLDYQINTIKERIKVLSTELGRFEQQLKHLSGE